MAGGLLVCLLDTSPKCIPAKKNSVEICLLKVKPKIDWPKTSKRGVRRGVWG